MADQGYRNIHIGLPEVSSACLFSPPRSRNVDAVKGIMGDPPPLRAVQKVSLLFVLIVGAGAAAADAMLDAGLEAEDKVKDRLSNG